MQWQEVCENKSGQDLSFKTELNIKQTYI